MDSSTDINKDPLGTTAGVGGATSFASDFDMSAINEAVAAGGDADTIQNTFDVNDIDLDNTPTSDAELQNQLNKDPNMSLANSSDSIATIDPIAAATAPAPKEPAATFVDGDLMDEPVEEEPATIADLANNAEENLAIDPITNEPVETPVMEPLNDSNEEAVSPEVKEEIAAEENEKAPEQAPAAAAPVKKKSKMPIYIIAFLAVVAIAAVVIAVIVSQK